MPLLAATPDQSPAQLGIAALLAAAAFYWLLPKPRGRSLAFGTFAALASVAVLVSWALTHFGDPGPDLITQILFWLFSAGAVGFATMFVVQRNPARGAISFAFVIVSVCGLFLTLASPFLMAVTIIVYAGAIIVTFLFVLMLSDVGAPSDENDRSREPLLGSLGAFAFLGLILFALQQSSDAKYLLPVQPITLSEREALLDAAAKLKEAQTASNREDLLTLVTSARENIDLVVGSQRPGSSSLSIPDRLQPLKHDARSKYTITLSERIKSNAQKTFDDVENALLAKPNMTPADIGQATKSFPALRDDVLLLAGRGDLPARNVANLGYVLYSDHLLAIQMVGALLLIATIGAVIIAGRKGATA